MRRVVLFAAGVFAAITAYPSHGEQHVGNGGDPLMMIFDQARIDAAHILRQFSRIAIPTDPDDPHNVREFLLATEPTTGTPRYRAMAADVLASLHKWRDGDVGFNKCANTNRPDDRTSIYLSFDRCRALLSLTTKAEAEAVKTLIHESCHHFGRCHSDEGLATALARLVFDLWLADRRGIDPQWDALVVTDALPPRFAHTATWTGRDADPVLDNKIILWGGCVRTDLPNPRRCMTYLNDGGVLAVNRTRTRAYESAWEDIAAPRRPAGRKFHTAVWTGRNDFSPINGRMVIFGGCQGENGTCSRSYAVSACAIGEPEDCASPTRDLAVYNLRDDAWEPLLTEGAPTPRIQHTAVWTNSEMLVWGGLAGFENPAPDRPLGDGGRLTFSEEAPQGRWNPIPTTEQSPRARYGHTALWTGERLVVWGGCGRRSFIGCAEYLGDGGIYDPSTGAWRRIPVAPFLPGRLDHSMVFTGSHVVVWGGRNSSGMALESGGMFDLRTGADPAWTAVDPRLPVGANGRRGHAAVYDFMQGRMVVWGGERADGAMPRTTLVLDVENNTWSSPGIPLAPGGRFGHTALWIDDALVIWGGMGVGGDFLMDGAVLNL